MKVVDLKLVIDSLLLEDDITVDDFINGLNINSSYPVEYEILYEEQL